MSEILVSSDLFTSYFKSNIRVLFDWRRLKSEKWKIGLSVISSRSKLKKGCVPWYVGKKGKEVSYNASDAKPISLSAIDENLSALDKKRRRIISQLAKDFESSRQPIQFVAPAYDLGKQQFILLDGNHRLAALLLCKVEFRLMLFKVYGPLDSKVLPDLEYWS